MSDTAQKDRAQQSPERRLLTDIGRLFVAVHDGFPVTGAQRHLLLAIIAEHYARAWEGTAYAGAAPLVARRRAGGTRQVGRGRVMKGTVLGDLLRQYRERRNLAQNALARLTGINVGTINRIERGERLPTLEHVHLLAAALRLTPHETNYLAWSCGWRPIIHMKGATCRRWKRWARANGEAP